MGMATLRELNARHDADIQVTVIARDTPTNRKKLRQFSSLPGFRILWGDMLDKTIMSQGISDADMVFHFGGLVSPAADYNPQKTMKVNVGSAKLITECIKESGRENDIYLVYIGSVAQSGDNRPPHHWGSEGHPCVPAKDDPYAISKIEAERVIVDSGIKNWVSLRQTGILTPEIIKKGSDPITFHVPLKGVLEWTTDEDTGRLMAKIAQSTPEHGFWNRFHTIGGGESYRLTNFEFISLFLNALKCPPPEKVFKPQWFALYNFHGQWFSDSDRLEEMFHYRSGKTAEQYFSQLSSRLPWYVRLSKFVPAPLIRLGMRYIASKSPMGPLCWIKEKNKKRIENHFGSIQEWEEIPDWDILVPQLKQNLPRRPDNAPEQVDTTGLTINDMKLKAAEFGGRCLSEKMETGDMRTILKWECKNGHIFYGSPALVFLGGHRCPECLRSLCGKGG